MKKHFTIISAVIVLLVLFTACPSPPGIMGTEPLILGGHFLFEQVYDTGRNIYTYNADGTYVHIGNEWNDTLDKWEQTYGSKGTYLYDSSTYLMTWTCTERWGWGDVDDWYVIADNYENDDDILSWSVTEYSTTYFTNNGKYNAYMAQPGGSWVSESGYSHKEKRSNGDFEYCNKYTTVYEISSSEIMYSETQINKEWEDTTEEEALRRERGGGVRKMAPTDVEWKAGKTVTFYYGNDTNRWRDYDWDAKIWGDWQDSADGYTWTRTFVHLGDLILEVSVSSSKNLIVE